MIVSYHDKKACLNYSFVTCFCRMMNYVKKFVLNASFVRSKNQYKEKKKNPKGKKNTKNWLKVAVGINDRPLIKKMYISNFTFNI